MIDTVYRYQHLLEHIDTLIDESDYKKSYFYNQLNLSRQSFYLKLKKKNFSVGEMLQLTTILFPEEAKAFEIKRSIERGIKDIEAGRTKSHTEVMAHAEQLIDTWK
jgi:hypothetical protein